MTNKQFKIYKDVIKHEFVIDIEETELSVIIKLDGKQTLYEDGVLKFLSGQRINKQNVGGISITEEVKKEIEAARQRVREKYQNDTQNREADRPAPYVDEKKLFVYKLGCDTGLIYPESHRAAIESALRNGAKPEMIFRGSRDKSRKYPEMYDSNIPPSYVKKEGEKYVAEGYSQVWSEDVFALPYEIVEAEVKKIQEQKQKNKAEKEEKRSAIFVKAKETEEKQVLNQWSEECNDPDEECDIDNIIEYAMPDGTVKTERHHTW